MKNKFPQFPDFLTHHFFDFGICENCFLSNFEIVEFSVNNLIFNVSINFSNVDLYMDHAIHNFCTYVYMDVCIQPVDTLSTGVRSGLRGGWRGRTENTYIYWEVWVKPDLCPFVSGGQSQEQVVHFCRISHISRNTRVWSRYVSTLSWNTRVLELFLRHSGATPVHFLATSLNCVSLKEYHQLISSISFGRAYLCKHSLSSGIYRYLGVFSQHFLCFVWERGSGNGQEKGLYCHER